MPCSTDMCHPFNAGLADVLRCTRSFNSMDFTIRRAKREDCAEMLELIRELAVFERAPDAVTVTLEHFEESGFGEKPVWWAFVGCAPAAQQEAEASSSEAEQPAIIVQDPLLASLIPEVQTPTSDESIVAAHQVVESLTTEPGIQLDEPIAPSIPDAISEAMPLQVQQTQPCEKVIAFALYYIRYSTWKGQRMYLEDIIVTEGWRGRGVGTALMDALFGAAKVEKLHGISWQVLEWNKPAMKFYERYGVVFDREWANVAVDLQAIP